MSRVEEVIRYKTTDGKLFANHRQAIIHQLREDAAEASMNHLLGPQCDAPNFSNGGGYVQHRHDIHRRVEQAIRDLNGNRDSEGSLGIMIYRWNAIDTQGREWGQPYFKNHPHEAKMVCLEDRQ